MFLFFLNSMWLLFLHNKGIIRKAYNIFTLDAFTYVHSTGVVSVWLHNMTCEACVWCAMCQRVHADTGHSTHRSYYTAITLTAPVRPSMYPHEPSV